MGVERGAESGLNGVWRPSLEGSHASDQSLRLEPRGWGIVVSLGSVLVELAGRLLLPRPGVAQRLVAQLAAVCTEVSAASCPPRGGSKSQTLKPAWVHSCTGAWRWGVDSAAQTAQAVCLSPAPGPSPWLSRSAGARVQPSGPWGGSSVGCGRGGAPGSGRAGCRAMGEALRVAILWPWPLSGLQPQPNPLQPVPPLRHVPRAALWSSCQPGIPAGADAAGRRGAQ